MSELPKGWVNADIGDLCLKVTDGSHNPPKASDEGLPMLSAKNIHDGLVDFNERHRLIPVDQFDIEDKRTRIEAGDILLTIVGTLGRSAVVSSTAVKFTLQRSVAVLSAPQLNPYAFRYFLESHGFQKQLEEQAKGTAQKGIYLKALKQLTILVPPLAEQKRIVEKLDQVLAQVDTIKARLDGIPAILKRFRQSVLAAAVSGKLTEELKENWETQTLSSLCISISDGDHQAPPKSTDGIPFLVISNVNKKRIDLHSATRMVPRSYYDSLKPIRKPELNDILYTVTGSFGIPVIVDTNEPFCFQRHIAIIKPNHEVVHFKYLAYFLESPQVFRTAEELATGTAQKTLSLNSLRNFQINLPDLEEQTEIVRLVDQYFAFANTIEKQVQKAQQRVDKLTQSILAKAFRGELVPQNPDDEPADELLKRIAAARAESEALAKAAKKVGKRK